MVLVKGERAPRLVDLVNGYESLRVSFIIGGSRRFYNRVLFDMRFITVMGLFRAATVIRNYCFKHLSYVVFEVLRI